MQTHFAIHVFFTALQLSLLLLLPFWFISASGFGSMGPISASFGQDGFFCAIDASGKQDVVCWGKNSSSSSSSSSPSPSSSSSSAYYSDIPPMAALSGGKGFICGILANTSQAYCWSSIRPGIDLVPSVFKTTAYSNVAAGVNHVCAIRGPYYSDHNMGNVDCWDIDITKISSNNTSLTSKESTLFYNQSISNLVFKNLVSGEGFSCGGIREGGLVCWGPNSSSLEVVDVKENFIALASGKVSICGILDTSMEIKCWGDDNDWHSGPPNGSRFVSLAAGSRHFCGIREDNHGVECWGSFNSSAIPKASGFKAIASSDFTTCGIREDDLVLDCWAYNVPSSSSSSSSDSPPLLYDPPLELCSPGLCSPGPCSEREFTFNASILNEADLTNLCVRKDLKICSPCGSNCSDGFFLSSSCTDNSDRVCTACSLCQNSSCWDICGVHSPPEMKKLWHHLHRLVIIIGSSALVLLLILLGGCFVPRLIASKQEEGTKKKQSKNSELETDNNGDIHSLPSSTPCPGLAQVFRLSELKDATNGFKEFNELGRGSYGFVYKAVLPDGRQVAVKRANAATIIHTNSRDFEMELEVLCKIRHCNIVNLLGYCSEMGERLLVYEYMPHGTLYDHLHGGLSPLNWTLRLKISMQAAKGLEYLHKEFVPPIIHRDVKTSNILLDSEWSARIADFGLITSNDKDLSGEDLGSDVYNFGIVLLEILSGRKAYDRDYNPSSLVEWALPLIKQGKAAAIIDRYVALPRNVEPLLKLAEVAELAVRENVNERPSISDIASSLEQIVKEVLIL
ncbi:serine/threonine-protein kinase-like protein CCR1 [Cannabis sativa]|uniref:serine/threonine-protein kinase-like protein CCR1 n=1 Tax=Cannabis sativa TaxID=3483 RepID=UPI0029C9B329|nr:serine/threonine-protein kinase-like protein CCR1 [Cannabis sativa]